MGAILIGRLGWEIVEQATNELSVRVDAIGGLTMGADPIALMIATTALQENPSSKLQTFVVRKSAKSHGRQKLIEGNFVSGDSVVIVEDVLTTGGSTLQAIDAVESAGGTVAFVIVLVDRAEGGRENIERRGYRVLPIFSRADLIAENSSSRSRTASV